VVDVPQVQSTEQTVVLGESTSQRQSRLGDLLAQHPLGQVRQHGRVPLSGDQRLDHRSAGHTDGV
jgi:hypothetical protein